MPGGDDDGGQECARGGRCEERDYQGRPRLGPRAFCETDTRFIGRAIRDLPRTYAMLWLLLPVSQQAGERVSGSKDPPIPLAADVQAFMRQIVHVTLSWEQAVRQVRQLSAPPEGRRRDSVALAWASERLERHLPVLLALGPQLMARPVTIAEQRRLITTGDPRADQPGWVRWDTAGDAWATDEMDGTDAGLEFLALAGRARGLLGLSRQRRRLPEVPCDECKARTLVQYETRDEGGWEPVARCTNCPNTYTGPRFELLMGRVYRAQMEALDGAGTIRNGVS